MSEPYRLDLWTAEDDLPLVIRPGSADASVDALVEWIASQRTRLDAELLRYGAFLPFRGFAVGGAADFRKVVEAASEPIEYIGGISPRRKLADKVYEATYFPAHIKIKAHNEMANLNRWPARICFCCPTPPSAGGETPIADGRKILPVASSGNPREIRKRGSATFHVLVGVDGWDRSRHQTLGGGLRDR